MLNIDCNCLPKDEKFYIEFAIERNLKCDKKRVYKYCKKNKDEYWCRDAKKNVSIGRKSLKLIENIKTCE